MAPRKGKRRKHGTGSVYTDKATGRPVAAYRTSAGKLLRRRAAQAAPAGEDESRAWLAALQELEGAGYNLEDIPRDTLPRIADAETRRQWTETVQTYARAGASLSSAAETVQAFAARWFTDDLANRPGRSGDGLALGTWRSVRQHLELYILPTFGALSLRDANTAYRIEQWRNDLVRSTSARTAGHAFRTLRDMLDTAVRWDSLPHNAARRVEPPTVTTSEVEPLTLEHVRAVWGAVAGHRLEALFYVAPILGPRLGELLGLRWADLDWKKAELTIAGQVQTLEGKTKRRDTTKSPSGKRTVPVPPRTLAALERHYARQRLEAAAESDWREHGLIFPSSVGTPIVPRNLERTWYVVRDAAGLAGVVFHRFRHTCGALLTDVGASEAVIGAVLGHSRTGGSATRRYSHAFAKTVRRALEDVERLVWEDAAPLERQS